MIEDSLTMRSNKTKSTIENKRAAKMNEEIAHQLLALRRFFLECSPKCGENVKLSWYVEQ